MWIAVLVFVSIVDPTNVFMTHSTDAFADEKECEAVRDMALERPPFPSLAFGQCIDITQYLEVA